MRQRRRIGAYGVCRDDAGRVLLVRGAGPDFAGVWSIPGGGVDHGEAPRAGVVREFAEETGLAAEVVRLRDVVADLTFAPNAGEVVHNDRILYDVKVTGTELRHEANGGTDRAAWFDDREVAGLPLLPFAARLLGLPTEQPEIPPSQVVPTGPITHMQRFAAYGLATAASLGSSGADGSAASLGSSGADGSAASLGSSGAGSSAPSGRLLLTRIAPGYPGAGTWHLPGGGTDFGEQPTAGLLRELFEETGQRGRVTRLLEVLDRRVPRALGPEGYPIDWHTVRVVYRVEVDSPMSLSVLEPAGGSTAEARWISRDEIGELPLNSFAKGMIARHLGWLWVR